MNPADALHEAVRHAARFADDMFADQLEFTPQRGASKASAEYLEWYRMIWPRVALAVCLPETPKVYVTAEMCDLLVQAAPTFPATVPMGAEATPWGVAHVVFETPIAIDAIVGETRDTYGNEVVAVSWVNTAHPQGRTGAVEDGPHRCAIMMWQRDRADGTWLPTVTTLVNEGSTMHEMIDRANGNLDDGQGITDAREHYDQCFRILWAMWSLIVQRVAVHDRAHASRATRRRAERAGLPPIPAESTCVVRLRRPTAHSDDDGSDEARQVNWSHRWMVDSFWRTQHYGPGNSLVKDVWIAPHIKGPADKPLILKEKVYKWER